MNNTHWSNWKKLLIAIVILLILMANPITRSVILFLLPLGSGIDDLIFLILLFLFLVLLLLRLAPVQNRLKKLASWLMK